MQGFKNFIMRGNLVELAVAVVIGLAFAALITSLVENLITPLIAIPGSTDFSALSFSIGGGTFLYGAFINSLVTFVMVAAAIYFVVVVPMNKVAERKAAGQAPADATTKMCVECLTEIPVAARKCAACASVQEITLPQGSNVRTN